jgi:hypothetical protein
MLTNILPNEFCIWLKSVLDARKSDALTAPETALIRERLSKVFRHEIDPEMGDEDHQALLNNIHSGCPGVAEAVSPRAFTEGPCEPLQCCEKRHQRLSVHD